MAIFLTKKNCLLVTFQSSHNFHSQSDCSLAIPPPDTTFVAAPNSNINSFKLVHHPFCRKYFIVCTTFIHRSVECLSSKQYKTDISFTNCSYDNYSITRLAPSSKPFCIILPRTLQLKIYCSHCSLLHVCPFC